MAGSYYAGNAAGNNSNKQTTNANAYRKSQEATQEKLNHLTNDYESACYNYQALYTAYETLYEKVGLNSGLQKVARIDGARGNEESCYR